MKNEFGKTNPGIWDLKEIAIVIIDFQPQMLNSITSGNRDYIEHNTKALARLATALEIPTVMSSVGVGIGINDPVVSTISEELPAVQQIIDRNTMNAWDDEVFVAAVKATGKKKLVMVGLYTEICLTFPAIEALNEGFDVMTITDAIGGISIEANKIAIKRMIQAGVVPNTLVAFITEIFRDWTKPEVAKIGPILEWHKEFVTNINLPGVGVWQ